MATRKAATKEAEEFERIELDDAVVEDLDEGDLWNDLVKENPVPDLVVRGIRIKQPTKEQIDKWSELVAAQDPDAEKVLMPADDYDKLKSYFTKLPLSAWRNFQQKFTNHIFGLEDPVALGKRKRS